MEKRSDTAGVEEQILSQEQRTKKGTRKHIYTGKRKGKVSRRKQRNVYFVVIDVINVFLFFRPFSSVLIPQVFWVRNILRENFNHLKHSNNVFPECICKRITQSNVKRQCLFKISLIITQWLKATLQIFFHVKWRLQFFFKIWFIFGRLRWFSRMRCYKRARGVAGKYFAR